MFISQFLSFAKMAARSLKDQDRLDGASNFGIWKARMLFLLDEHGLKEFMTTFEVVPANPIQFHDNRKDMAKAKRMVLDGV